MSIQELSEIARSVGISSRHVLKAQSFRQVVIDSLGKRPKNVVNLFCGNGIATWHWLRQDDDVQIISSDIRITSKYNTIEREVLALNPNLVGRNVFVQTDLTHDDFYANLGSNPAANYLAIAIHACGTLSDAFIRNCARYGLDFAVATCCHSKTQLVLEPQEYPNGALYSEDDFALYQDLVRAQFAREQGYNVMAVTFSSEITPMNHVLVGVKN